MAQQANAFSPIFISAVKVLARLAAKKAVQQKLRDQGVRVTTYPYADLMRQAHEYLDNHPELYVAALERAKRMLAEGVLGKRAQRAYLINSAQTKDNAEFNGFGCADLRCKMIDIEREIAWLLAQQYRGRAKGLVIRREDDHRLRKGEYGWADTDCAADGPKRGRVRSLLGWLCQPSYRPTT